MDSCVSKSGQVAVDFCPGCQGKGFHFDSFIASLSFLLSQLVLSGSFTVLVTHYQKWDSEDLF